MTTKHTQFIALPELARILADLSNRMHEGSKFYESVSQLCDGSRQEKAKTSATLCGKIEKALDELVCDINCLSRLQKEFTNGGQPETSVSEAAKEG